MKLRVLALDFDGTIAVHGRLDAAVADAIREARRAAVMTVLVSGRMLNEIQAALPAPDLFDAVVAENGAVVQMQNAADPIVLARGPHPAFVAELHRRGAQPRLGLCMAEFDAVAAPDVVASLHALDIPYGIGFERGKLLVLPPGVSKASGLREAVWRLGCSIHNAVAIGDAEDDVPMVDACEIGAAVAWGSGTLQRAVGELVPGSDPAAVADYIRRLLGSPTVPPIRPRRSPLRLRLGTRADGTPVDTDDRGRNVVVAGDAKSGKTWLVGMLSEQLILRRYALCILDPEGDYACLGALPGVIIHRVHPNDEPLPESLERLCRQPLLSVVVDLSALATGAKRAAARALLRGVDALRRTLGVPHRVVLDEAHYFLHSAEDATLFDAELGGYCLVTYRIPDVAPAVLDACDAILVTKLADRQLAAQLLRFTGLTASSEWIDVMATLSIGEAVLLPRDPEDEHGITRFTFAPRLTHHVRHRQKYMDVGVAPGREFVFTRNGYAMSHRARTLQEFLAVLPDIPDDVFTRHLRCGDFHRWLEHAVGDHALGEAIRVIEAGGAENGDTRAARKAVARAICDRYLEPEAVDDTRANARPTAAVTEG